MNRITGRYVVTTTLGETVKAFVPLALPPAKPSLDINLYAAQNQAAESSLARLSSVAGLVPSTEWLLYSAIRKEALLTSQIEGTQATLVDLFDDEAGLALTNADDVEEVTNYLRAFRYVREQLHRPKGLPVSTRLLCEVHRLLLNGARGINKQPGELRRSQNWIGGSRPGNAVFVPPPPEKLAGLLSELETYIHQRKPSLPALINIALVHAQFETIHPFLDGNGRIGRLLIAILLESAGLQPEPLLYLSGYLKQHQQQYYQLLSDIRTKGDWEGWVTFFLNAIISAANDAEKSVVSIATLVAQDRKRVLAAAKATPATYRLFERLPTMPKFTIEHVRVALDTTFPTANAAVKVLCDIGITNEVTGQKKNRTFSYAAYIALLSK